MSLLDSILGFATGTYTVTRRATGTFVNGVYVPAVATTTFSIVGVVQPALGLQRVVGGHDMRETQFNQYVSDIRVVYTETELRTRKPTQDPDIVTVEGDDWTVFRVERWDHYGTTFYMAVITRETEGAS